MKKPPPLVIRIHRKDEIDEKEFNSLREALEYGFAVWTSQNTILHMTLYDENNRVVHEWPRNHVERERIL